MVSLADGLSSGQDFSWCAGSGKCSLLLSALDLNIIAGLVCSFDSNPESEKSIYLSPILEQGYGGIFFNKRIPVNQRNRIDAYVQRSFEMGLEDKKGITS